MSNEASRIRRIISGLRDGEDIAEIVKMAQIEVAEAVSYLDPRRFDRGVAIYKAGMEALGNANVQMQLPDYTHAA